MSKKPYVKPNKLEQLSVAHSFLTQSYWFGVVDYSYALGLQADHHALVTQGSYDRILGLEHPLVITLGKRGSEDDLILNRGSGSISELNKKPVMVISTDRGGQATVHNEGQLVIYPIVDLRRKKVNIQDFICQLLQITKKALFEYGISAESGEGGVGLFTVKGKIASVGLRVDQGVTRHGLSINIHNDLTDFNRIRTCGMYNRSMSSVKDFGVEIDCQKFFNTWMKYYQCATLDQCLSIPKTLNDFCSKGLESGPSH